MFSIVLSIVLLVLLLVGMIVLNGRKPMICVEKDGVFVRDFMYPSAILAETIKSVGLCETMPKLSLRTNGYANSKVCKGFFSIYKNGLRTAILYLERRKNGPFIEIETTNKLYYINLSDESRTRQLYDEIMSTVKFVDEKNLVSVKTTSSHRSIFIIALLVFAIGIITVIPILGLKGEEPDIIVNHDVVKINGMYSIEIPISEIDTVVLVERLPKVKSKTNGVSMSHLSLGKFKLADGRKCRLYIYNDEMPPYIEIVAANELIFINMEAAEETEELFRSIKY